MTEAALNLPCEPALPQPIVDMAEPARFASERRIVAAESSGAAITLAFDDGVNLRLHPLWLRSECACPVCRDRVTLERTFDQFRLPPDLAPARVEVTAAGALQLTWADGHVSLFDPGWLHRNARRQGPEFTGRGTPPCGTPPISRVRSRPSSTTRSCRSPRPCTPGSSPCAIRASRCSPACPPPCARSSASRAASRCRATAISAPCST